MPPYIALLRWTQKGMRMSRRVLLDWIGPKRP